MSWRHRRQVDAEARILEALGVLAGVSPALGLDDWHYGLDLMRRTKMRAGRFYPALDRLERAELIEAKWDDKPVSKRHPDLHRRMYRLVAGS